jgi:hypothetical protein
VLDVDGGEDVDACGQELLDVAHALGVPAPGRVRVRQLVYQDELRPAHEDGVEVHLLEHLPAVLDPPPREDLQPSSSASVSLRPCVSTTPTTTSTPSFSLAWAACSIS